MSFSASPCVETVAYRRREAQKDITALDLFHPRSWQGNNTVTRPEQGPNQRRKAVAIAWSIGGLQDASPRIVEVTRAAT